MAEETELPEGVDENYANTAVADAIRTLQETPDYERLAELLNALREGFLVVDITGTSSKKKGPRVRTIRSTKGQLVLPLFTSMDELRAAVPAPQREQVKGALMPARTALSLIASDRFVAAEFNKASAAFVCVRKFVELAASDAEITAASLAA